MFDRHPLLSVDVHSNLFRLCLIDWKLTLIKINPHYARTQRIDSRLEWRLIDGKSICFLYTQRREYTHSRILYAILFRYNKIKSFCVFLRNIKQTPDYTYVPSNRFFVKNVKNQIYP